MENYGQYVDYNSITTQSDRGEMLYTLLDFLRLRANYDRLAWNLRPVVLAHRGVWCAAAATGRPRYGAGPWPSGPRRSPRNTWQRFDRLCKQYGMRLPSIAERLGERFIRPLEIDRLCALVRPAMEEIREAAGRQPWNSWSSKSPFTKEPAGAGFELPGWLEALEQEMEHVHWQSDEEDEETSGPLASAA